MPRINTSVDDLQSDSDRACDFPTKPVVLEIDPIMTNDYEVCAEKLRVSGSEEKEVERSARRSTDCSTSTRQSSFFPKIDFVGKFDEIDIKPNDMLKSFQKTFAINITSQSTSSPLTKQAVKAHSTVTKEEMTDLRFVHDHNMTAFLGEPPAKHSEFKSMIEGLILSPVNYATMEYPLIITSFIRDFWSTVEESTDADGNISIVGKIQGHSIIISEQIIRDCLQFGDK
ncbi:hypothetical protein R6Q59_023442 [Mikania micrantha]